MKELEAAVRAFLDAHDSEATYAAIQGMRRALEDLDRLEAVRAAKLGLATTERT